jgi:hypothetical protein
MKTYGPIRRPADILLLLAGVIVILAGWIGVVVGGRGSLTTAPRASAWAAREAGTSSSPYGLG